MENVPEVIELVIKPNGNKEPEAADTLNGAETRAHAWIREGWEQAKKEGRLSGCGLMGKMTVEDIEEMEEAVRVAMTTWARLAGTYKGGISIEDKKDISVAINTLTADLKAARNEIAALRKTIDAQANLTQLLEDLKALKSPQPIGIVE